MRRTDADYLIHVQEPVSSLAVLDEIVVRVAEEHNLHVSIHVNHPEEIDPDEDEKFGVGCTTAYSPLARHKIISEALDLCKRDFPEEAERIELYTDEIAEIEEGLGGTPQEFLAEQNKDAEAGRALSAAVEDLDQAAFDDSMELITQLEKLLGLPCDQTNEQILEAVRELQRAAKGN